MIITNSSFMPNPVTDPKTDPMADLVTDTMTITITGPMTDQNCNIRAVWFLVKIYPIPKMSLQQFGPCSYCLALLHIALGL